MKLDRLLLNNIAESWNHELKSYIKFKLLGPIDLTENLTALLDHQFNEMRRAVQCKGEYLVSSEYHAKSDDEIQKLYQTILEGVNIERPIKEQKRSWTQNSSYQNVVLVDKYRCVKSDDGVVSMQVGKLFPARKPGHTRRSKTFTQKKRKAEDFSRVYKFISYAVNITVIFI